MSQHRAVKITLAVLTIATVAIVAIADVFNSTHLFNPAWPGHARFHIGMQFTTLVLVASVSLMALIGPLTRERLMIAALANLSFWPGLLVAYLIPGTDVYASEGMRAVGFPINIALAIAFIVSSLAALGFGLRALVKNAAS